jgi:hypothetical protein
LALTQVGWTVVRVWEHQPVNDGVSAVKGALPSAAQQERESGLRQRLRRE